MLYIASDHAGFELKESLKKQLSHLDWKDLGTHSKDSVHYPEFAQKLAQSVSLSELDLQQPCGILICGSGIGVSIAANRFPKIRAALIWNKETALLAREHNNANVLCLPARFLSADDAVECVKAWLEAKFLAGRHQQRVDMLGKVGARE
jgi:ribose 5-phosphate isomerase B